VAAPRFFTYAFRACWFLARPDAIFVGPAPPD
jgi:hypothetical protein